ncbi:hypothetical protein Nepgr_017583 [Nepenthes gracilis]|uniref:non-specific serine/threonine protein kinase n=1 Tax=Nepenthes gracilis TaxID=150966 RepID=A0AAD3SRD8_NEPGR|nr:hypothetical protein Nepgr_017583 [Nepenthes gracilis]
MEKLSSDAGMAMLALLVLLLIAPVSSIICSGETQGKRLAAGEVNTLRDIAKELGKHDWDFSVDPCSQQSSWYTQSILDKPYYVNQITCNCSGVVCHVCNISLKGQDLAGSLPKSLAKLPYIKVIDLTRNYLTGTIPLEWASAKLEYLSVIVNKLSGPIPRYLGNFGTLTYLSIENNLFSGYVPAELGKLVNLNSLILSANNLTGELPKELTNLTNLTELRISSNSFSGKIPDYFRSWKNLEKLEIQGSGLEGPIPASLSVLDALTELRISDLNGEESSEFPSLSRMPNLSKLMLRSCKISGSIPNNIANLGQLTTLDLSFNELEGPVPNLGALNLEYMYLTGNFLSGIIPDWIKNSGSAIDLSYNNFDKSSVPTSCRDNLNLYRSFSRASNSTLAMCLDTCSRVKYSVNINCGGKEIPIGETSFDEDVEPGGAAKFVPRRVEWGFSSTGNFWNLKPSGNYIATNSSALLMKDSELDTDARLSAISLTYYGRCLAPGNYTVTLYFSEITFTDNKSFFSLGTRTFDVYIQEKLVLKDFDIRKEANGTDKPLNRTFFHIPVENTIEIRFYYAGKGTTAVPMRGYYGPLISALSVKSEFSPPPDRKKVVKIVLGAVTSFLGLLFIVFGFIWWKHRSEDSISREQELKGLDLKAGLFTFRQLKAATDNFHADNKIGEGGFGSVYKGTLLDGTHIAVKHLFSRSSQGNREFVNEIGMISGLCHPNLVRLYGCCVEGSHFILVYEYMVNNNLSHALFGACDGQLKLDWHARRKICVDIARGLTFLHEESPIKIVHRDIKTTNILLDKDLNAKISDFGLARLDEEEKTHISTRIAGTIGYMAPEYVLWGYLTYKADVYSFGIVALEIVSGRSNMSFRPDEDHFCLLDWAMCLRQKGDLMELVDPRLGSDYDKEVALRIIKVALFCTNPSPALRPTMSAVVRMLEGDLLVDDSFMEVSVYSNEYIIEASRRQHNQLDLEDASQTHSLLPPSDVQSFDRSFSTSNSHDLIDLEAASQTHSLLSPSDVHSFDRSRSAANSDI